MQQVTSSNIVEMGHEANELHVRFKSSAYVYVYPGVARETYDAILASPSICSAFHHLVKKAVDPTLVRKEK